MLKSVDLEDFRTHESTRIEFDPVLTAIVGDNDSGKSNILRAILGVLRGADWPVGDEDGAGVVRRGAQRAAVVVEVDNILLTRVRTKSKNELVVDCNEDAGLVTEHFETIRDVRALLPDITGFRLSELDKGTEVDLNSQAAGDGRFLLGGARPDTLLRRVSRLFGAQTLEQAKRQLQNELRDLVSAATAQERLLEQAQSHVEAWSGPAQQVAESLEALDAARAALLEAEDYQEKVTTLHAKLEAVQPILDVDMPAHRRAAEIAGGWEEALVTRGQATEQLTEMAERAESVRPVLDVSTTHIVGFHGLVVQAMNEMVGPVAQRLIDVVMLLDRAQQVQDIPDEQMERLQAARASVEQWAETQEERAYAARGAGHLVERLDDCDEKIAATDAAEPQQRLRDCRERVRAALRALGECPTCGAVTVNA